MLLNAIEQFHIIGKRRNAGHRHWESDLPQHYAMQLHLQNTSRSRGVQYVHCVMHKCIMVKVGGKRNTHKKKEIKKYMNLSKTGGKFFKVGGNNNFRETEGNVLKQGK